VKRVKRENAADLEQGSGGTEPGREMDMLGEEKMKLRTMLGWKPFASQMEERYGSKGAVRKHVFTCVVYDRLVLLLLLVFYWNSPPPSIFARLFSLCSPFFISLST